jgi:hypothetical protein
MCANNDQSFWPFTKRSVADVASASKQLDPLIGHLIPRQMHIGGAPPFRY